jgi:glycosyltransferase involved in cell wall biosynthesis
MSTVSKRRTHSVCIVQRRLTHYRVPFFEVLRKELDLRGIGLALLVGKGTLEEEKKRDTGNLAWAVHLPTHYFFQNQICWQPVRSHLGDSDLVIVTQENKLLYNLLLLLRPRRFRLAFWGHGANLQSDNPDGFKERFKRWTTGQVDWWFAYTQLSADLVGAQGFPASSITVLNNSADTSELRRHKASISSPETRVLRDSLGFGDSPVGVFVGSLYADKRLDFLFAAVETIRQEVPDFQLLLVGDGPERGKVQSWCGAHPWVRWVGARVGREKVAHISLAQLMLNPGLVGLGVLDSFVCGVPMVTTDCGIHSPEIAYLDNGRNGIMTANDLDDYAAAVVHLLRDPDALRALSAGCEASALEYTVENMAAHFADGIERCLNLELKA